MRETMKRVQLLDCTLRDGGYLVDAQFGNTVIRGIIKGLADSGIDVVECGFLKDEPHEKGSTIFNNAAQLHNKSGPPGCQSTGCE